MNATEVIENKKDHCVLFKTTSVRKIWKLAPMLLFCSSRTSQVWSESLEMSKKARLLFMVRALQYIQLHSIISVPVGRQVGWRDEASLGSRSKAHARSNGWSHKIWAQIRGLPGHKAFFTCCRANIMYFPSLGWSGLKVSFHWLWISPKGKNWQLGHMFNENQTQKKASMVKFEGFELNLSKVLKA